MRLVRNPCTILFADDIVSCGHSRLQGWENPEGWRYAQERRAMKVSQVKRQHIVNVKDPGAAVDMR